ncbi:MAG: YdcF family protein [Candidatus Kerfeldbacteria bacterium]|nr:YdcF family protein [Candidatus Kerfeldbacteria bacterium]
MKWWQSSKGWWWLGATLGVWCVLILFTPWPTQVLGLPLTVGETPGSADVIIVLGAGTRRGPVSLPVQAMDRLRQAKRLWDQDLAPLVIVAGGFSRRTHQAESRYMKPYLTSLGVPNESIIEENQSLDTYQNAINSQRLMEANRWDTALVVTSSYHTWRSCRVFRALRVDIVCVAASLDDHDSVYERLINFRSVVREYGAIVYYWLRGYL